MDLNSDKYLTEVALKVAKDKALLKKFRLASRLDSLNSLLDTTHKEYETLSQPYLPKQYNVSKSLDKIIEIPKDILTEDAVRQILGEEITSAYYKEVRRIEDNYQLSKEWINASGNEKIKEMLMNISDSLCIRLENQFTWHNKIIKPLADTPIEYDNLVGKITEHYKKALYVTTYQYYISQFPNLLDKAGIMLPTEYRLSRKLAAQNIDIEIAHKIPDTSQIFNAGVFIGADILKLSPKAIENELPKQRNASTIKFTVMDLLRLSVPLGKDFSKTQYVLPLEKIMYQCYPHTMLNPERIRYKGGIFSSYIKILKEAIDGEKPEISEVTKAIPEIQEILDTQAEKYRNDIIIGKYFKPLLNEASENLAQYIAKKLGVKLRRGDNNSANKIRLYTKKEMRGLKNDILFNALELDKLDTVTLNILCVDKTTYDILKKIRAHPNTPLPEISQTPGVSSRKVICLRKDAADICDKVQCISEPHRISMGIIPLRDIVMQGIYTTFSKRNLEESFGWHIDTEEMQNVVSPAVWDVYFHMGQEGALQFPYHHRIGFPGEGGTVYDAHYEEARKGIPITNTRKPAGSDMTSGKYKKSMNPTTAGIDIGDAKFANNLPYFTIDAISPQLQELSYRLIVCDYLKETKKLTTEENINRYTELLKKYDPIKNVSAIDDKKRKVIIIEGEKKALALKNLNDNGYFTALETYDKTGELPKTRPQKIVSLGVGGVWFTKSKSNSLNSDMTTAFDPKGRVVGLCFDKDSAIKPQVAQAFLRAAHAFKKAGAKVECQLLLGPNQIDPHAKGLDDEIAASYKQELNSLKENNAILDNDARALAIRRSYKKYAKIFDRCTLPARDNVPYQKEAEILQEVDKYARKRMKDIGINPEKGLQYIPEEIQFAYCATMVPLNKLMAHLKEEIEIKKANEIQQPKNTNEKDTKKEHKSAAIPIIDIV